MAGDERSRTNGRRPRAPAVDRALTVLEILSESDELSLTEIARQADVPLASCSAILRTLEDRGYVNERVSGRTHFWSPTLAMYRVGASLVARRPLAAVAQPHLQALADDLELPAHAGVLEGNQVINVAKAAATSFVQFHTYAGSSAAFNYTAMGRVIAAHLPPDRLARLTADMVPGGGPKAKPVDADTLLTELAQVREAGHAIEDQEDYADVAAVAAPVFDAHASIAGGVSVTGFSSDILERRRDEVVLRVRQAASAVSADLGAPS